MTMNVINADFSLKDLLDLQKKDLMLSLNCHALATVQSFDPDTQKITAKMNYKKSFVQKNERGITGTVLADYPVLVDVPVVILQGGTGSLTFPIAAGDGCLILFNDRDIDNWFHSGSSDQAPASQRLHSFADGIALVGLRSFNDPLSDYDTDHALLQRAGGGRVGAGADKVLIANAGADTLNDLLQELIDEVKDLVSKVAAITVLGVTSGGAVSGIPSNAAAITAISTDLTATATKIGGLLE